MWDMTQCFDEIWDTHLQTVIGVSFKKMQSQKF